MESTEYVPIKQELQNYPDESSENFVDNNYSPDDENKYEENSYTRIKEESGENNYNYSKGNYCVENNVERNIENYSTLEQSIENNYLTRIEQNIENYSTRIEQIENNYLNRIEQSDYTKQNENNYTQIPNYSENANYTQEDESYSENVNNSNDYSENVDSSYTENVDSSYTENENNVSASTHNTEENVSLSENGADNIEKKPARSRKRKLPENKVKGKPGRKPGRKKIKPEIIEGVEIEDDEVNLPSKDLNTLFNHISKATPIGDNLGFRTRLKKLDWTTIAFDNYTPEACMEAWDKIQNRQRHFRLLSELLNDAREWIKRPVQDLTKANKSKYPDFPKRPLSGYMLFYNERKEQILLDNPGIRLGDIARIIGHDFHAVDEATRNRYLQIAAKNRERYEIEVEEFYNKHPDVPRTSEKPLIEKKDLMKKPRKPQVPFAIYFEEQLKAHATIEDRAGFKEQCKEAWRNLADDKKLNYINLSLAQETQYQQDLKVYLENHPEYVPPHVNILTKEEKTIKSKQDGKPEKPPNSAYSLYSRILLKSGELRGVTTRERMKIIAVKWKELSQQERDIYKDQANNLMHQYKLDYAAYLESLPEEKRTEEVRLSQATSRKKKVEGQKEIKTEEFDVQETKESQLIEVVTPSCWDAMTEVERSMYVKYIQKIKGYFDMQHISAKLQASSSSDSHSDSDASEN